MDETIPDFVFTRHLFSCNNSHKEDRNWSRYKEPMLSSLGIITGLLLNKETTSHVFVSCLIRTWLTAIILYLPSAPVGDFNLYVSPFIKEKHSDFGFGLDKGNTPLYSIPQQVEFMLNFFFEKLGSDIFSDKKLHELGLNEFKINEIKDKIDKIKTRMDDIVVHYFSNNESKEYYGSRLYYSKINVENVKIHTLKIPTSSPSSMKGGSVEKTVDTTTDINTDEKKYDKQELGSINVNDINALTNLPSTFSYNHYHVDGLFLFMRFIKSKVLLPKYYVVTHSKLMEEFLQLISQGILTTTTTTNLEGIIHDIHKTNACEFSFNRNKYLVHGLMSKKSKSLKIVPDPNPVYNLTYTSGAPSFELFVESKKRMPDFSLFDKKPCDYSQSEHRARYKTNKATRRNNSHLGGRKTKNYKRNHTNKCKIKQGRLKRKRSFHR